MKVLLSVAKITGLTLLIVVSITISSVFVVFLDRYIEHLYSTRACAMYGRLTMFLESYPLSWLIDPIPPALSWWCSLLNVGVLASGVYAIVAFICRVVSEPCAQQVRWHVRCLVMSVFMYIAVLIAALGATTGESTNAFVTEGAFSVILTWPFWRGVETPLGPFFAFPYALAWGYGLMYLGRWIWRRFLRGRFSRGGAGVGAASTSEAEAVSVFESPEGPSHEGPSKDDA